ncbi:MjaI family restriction endonuclease [Tannerella sp. AM09-19]|nr:MjaI family restriction endonuclease [Tannerella sp. AM09-19]
MRKKIYNSEIESLSDAPFYEFPKYTTQIVNLVNSNAQGTRPCVVGQMSELIQEFDGKTLNEWIEWYTAKQPNAISAATDKIYSKFLEMKEAVNVIDKELIEEWVKDLVFTKTYCGLKFQSAIIAFIANELGKEWRLANVEEEAKGIDGYIGEKPLQIKSITYKMENRLAEVIDIPIIYYDKKKDGIIVEYEPEKFE